MSSVASHTHHHHTKHNAAIEFCVPESNQKASLHTLHTDLLKFENCLQAKRPLNLSNTFGVCTLTETARCIRLTHTVSLCYVRIRLDRILRNLSQQLNVAVCVRVLMHSIFCVYFTLQQYSQRSSV